MPHWENPPGMAYPAGASKKTPPFGGVSSIPTIVGLATVRKQRNDEQSHNVDNFDQRINSRARRVLVGVPHGVARDRRLVGVGTLAAEVAVLDVLLGVVPGAAARGHGYGHEQAGDDGADEHAAQGLRPE